MNWDAMGAIGEVVGAVGVIATLGYLAVQIRQNTGAQSAATELEKSTAYSRFHSYMASSETLADIWEKGFEDETSLTPHEKRRFIWVIADYFLSVEGLYNQYSLGYVSNESWMQHKRVVLGMLKHPLIRRWWDNRTTPITDTFWNRLTVDLQDDIPGEWKFQKLSDL